MKEYRILTHKFWEFKGEKIKSQQILKKKNPNVIQMLPGKIMSWNNHWTIYLSLNTTTLNNLGILFKKKNPRFSLQAFSFF